jgi:hypothetical protein
MFLVPAMNGWLLALGAFAVTGALSLETWKFLETKAADDRHSRVRLEAEITAESLEARLQHPEDCTGFLAGQAVEPGRRTPVELKYELNPDDELKLVEVKLEVPEQEDFRTEILNAEGVSVELRRYPARIATAFANAHGNGVELNRPKTIFLWTTPPPPIGNGQIQSCFGENSAGTLCNDLGGYFIPGSKSYDESCRFSLKTAKRVGGNLVPVSNCRVAGMADSPKKCARYGLLYGAQQLNGIAKVIPGPGNKFLCQICQ